MSYFAVIVIIGILILIHEWGHFIAARLSGVPVATFSIGFGPKLWGFKMKETDFRISWIPLGGYVLPEVEDEEEFFKIPAGKRLAFAIGGPIANILFAILGYSLLSLFTGGFSFSGTLVQPVVQTFQYLLKVFMVIPMLFVNPSQLSGMVGIVSQGAQFMGSDMLKGLQFAIMISINLAVFNLLPIPGLDGGKIMLTALEKIHPKMLKLQLPLTIAGLIFIIGLVLFATIKDVGKLLS